MLDRQRFERFTLPRIQDKYVKALADKGVNISPCLRCGSHSYGVFGASARHGLFGTRQSVVTELPCVFIVCTNCGFKSEFSIEDLGIKDKDMT